MKLKALIAQYVAFRKSLGAHFENAEGRLNSFCRCMGEEINVTDVQAERVNAFLAGTGPVTRSWQDRYGLLNGLYRYAISRGLVVTSPHCPLSTAGVTCRRASTPSPGSSSSLISATTPSACICSAGY